MGSYVSVPECQTRYNITLNCAIEGRNVTGDNGEIGQQTPFTKIGDYSKGNFPGDPDIAGIGILGVFVAVTSFAIFAGCMSIVWQTIKCCRLRKKANYTDEVERQRRTSFSDILETLVLACSDQQVFTGGAYALTLRYWRGCTISAYHYNIVANMMLLTCATHLISVTIVRNYWRFPWLAILRVICITFIFIATGLLMTNQNTDLDRTFPTGIPNANETDSLLFLAAACFQNDEPTAADTFGETTSSAQVFFVDNIAESTPRNKIQGWNLYILTLLFYGAATLAEIVRFFRRGSSRPGWRGHIGKQFRRCCSIGTILRKFVQTVFLIYLSAGVGLSCAVTIISSQYIFNLRRWVDRSGWIEVENNQNPENDSKSFGQLVPILSSALILFSFAQIISEKLTRHNNHKHEGEPLPTQTGTVPYLDPSAYNLVSPRDPEKGLSGSVRSLGQMTASLPPQVELNPQRFPRADPNFTDSQSATPLLGHDGYFPVCVAPHPNIPMGHARSTSQSTQLGSGSPSLNVSHLRTQDDVRVISPSSSFGTDTSQTRSLVGSPNLTQHSASGSVSSSIRYSTRPS
ncbi:hypothetical protein GGR53DRAFT_296690 [Hypoxylon sp. FL1150]|nr:hypothetical protein GGR53DRAFT_296690 [Hypoxylon sp. FL1150]